MHGAPADALASAVEGCRRQRTWRCIEGMCKGAPPAHAIAMPLA